MTDKPQSVWKRIPWLMLAGGMAAALDLLWCWACFSDEEGPGGGMAMALWLLIQVAFVVTASVLILIGCIVTKRRSRWLGWPLLIAAWVPVYFWWQSGNLPFFRH